MEISEFAQKGFAHSAAYDVHRPPYPKAAFDRLVEVLEVEGVTGAKILDLGAGTGKLTQLFGSRGEKYEVVAVEPHDGMRKELEGKGLARVEIMKGTAQKMETVPDHSVDAVVASQAFHWFATKQALQEIHRVLKPTGVLGMIWNIEDYNAPVSWEVRSNWEKIMKDVMWSFKDDVARFREMKWQQVFEEQGRSNPITLHFSTPLFGLPIGEQTFEFDRYLSREQVWSTFQTYSQVANATPERRAEIESILKNALESTDTEYDDEGRVAVHGKTYLAWASSIPDEPLKSGG